MASTLLTAQEEWGRPREWPVVRFGDVVRQVKDKADPETSGLERYVAGEHMDTDDLRLRRWGLIGDGYLGPAFHRHFRPGQVLYGSRRTYLRKVAIADFEGICANTTFVCQPSTDALSPAYLPYVMQAESFHAHSIRESKGSVNPYINWSDLTWYEFPLPPINRQLEIVAILNTAREYLERLLEGRSASAQISAAVLRDAVDGAAAWTTCEHIVSTARAGGTPSRADDGNFGGPVPWLKSGEVIGDGIATTAESLTERGLASSSAWVVPAGAVVVAMYGAGETRGKVGRLGRSMATNQAVLALLPNPEEADADFFYHWLASRTENLRARAAGAAQPNLSKKLVLEEPFPVLPLPRQRAVATALRECTATGTALDAQLNITRRILAHLRESLMGGRGE